jgi:hypothetical protein
LLGGNFPNCALNEIGMIHGDRTVDQANSNLRAPAADPHERRQANQFKR